MDLIKFVAPVVTNPLTVYAVVFLLILWAFLSGISLWRSAARFRAALDKARLRLEEATDAVAFASNFEAIRSDLGSMPVIGERRRDYCNSVIVIDRPIWERNPHWREQVDDLLRKSEWTEQQGTDL